MNKEQKISLGKIIIASLFILIFHFLNLKGTLRFFLYMIPYLIVGYDILIEAFEGLKNKEAFDESLLMAIATIGAIFLALYSKSGDFTEAIAVMLLFQIGEFFESYAVGKSRKSISSLMDIKSDYANIKDENGKIVKVNPNDVKIGESIIVKVGEKIPIDGVILEGTSSLDTKSLTGEFLPKDVSIGSEVFSGSINLSSPIMIKTSKKFEDSTASKILELIEVASSKKSKSENFISKFARVYTPIVVYLAIILTFLPAIFLIFIGKDPMWSTWIYRSLTFLIISCPCALVISIPLSFFAGIGGASKRGILIKGSNYMEILSKTDQVVFDKTGTLTEGSFSVSAIHPERISENELLHLASHVERYSNHPIADSLKKAYPNENDKCEVSDIKEFAGYGISAIVNGNLIYVGNEKMMERFNISWKNCKKVGTIVHIAINNIYEGHIVISDNLKKNSKEAIEALRKNNISKIIMLTGDRKEVAEDIADRLKIDEYHANLLPEDKVNKLEEILNKNKDHNKKIAFVGDGINDAPVLSRSDIGIAMGAMGQDLAIEAADVVLMDDDPIKISTAINLSRKCLKIVKENIYFSIFIKVLVLTLSALGLTSMWAAIFADVGVTIIAILNAMRCLY